MNYDTPERADALAAEYVLGTLRGPARARFARLAQTRPAVGDALRAWEERLLPLAEAAPSVKPPARVWQSVLARIQRGKTMAPARAPASIWSSLALWRSLALVGFATAFALSIALLAPPEEPGAGYVVVLAGPDAKPALVVSAQRAGRVLTVKALGVQPVAGDRTLQLWALPAAGNPRPLGLLPASGIASIPLAAADATDLATVPALAVSLEPKGGSPTGLPTGPVLYSGPVQRLY